MDSEALKKYAPWLVVVFCFLMQYKVFCTPVQLEELHRVVLMEVAERYTTKEISNQQRAQLDDMQHKIDKIYDKIMSR